MDKDKQKNRLPENYSDDPSYAENLTPEELKELLEEIEDDTGDYQINIEHDPDEFMD